ncbi:MAG: low-affinity phosphate transporter [Geoglossum simile]|nr:MAG: low-affinity phosphate transporter [Geoglossum simile]
MQPQATPEEAFVNIQSFHLPVTSSSTPQARRPDTFAHLAPPSPVGLAGGKRTQKSPSVDFELKDLSQLVSRRRTERLQRKREAKRRQKLAKFTVESEMKFSHSLQFNAVPDWSSYYIAYSNLKKLIFQLEKSIHQSNLQTTEGQDAEASPLLDNSSQNPDQAFRRALDSELERVCSFYQLKELEIYGEVSSLLQDKESYEDETEGMDDDLSPGSSGGRGLGSRAGHLRQGSIFRNFGLGSFGGRRRTSTLSASIDGEDESDEDDADERAALWKTKRRRTWDTDAQQSVEDMRSSGEFSKPKRRTSQAFDDYVDQSFAALYRSGITLKKRAISLYVSLCELKSFIQLNKTGFTKALKKYDKILGRHLKTSYLEESVLTAYPFETETMGHLEENICKIEQAYADIVTKGDVELAKRELRLNLREHVVWERNTVWREMIGIERKSQAANLGLRQTLLGGDQDPAKARLQGDDMDDYGTKELQTPLGKLYYPKWLFSLNFFILVGVTGIFVVLLKVPVLRNPEQQNCLAMLVFVSLLWATEVIPLFVTSLLIPFLVVTLRVIRSTDKPHERLGSKEAAKFIFGAMWTPVIMLLLGGFAIAAALSKYHIAKLLATFVLSKAGTRPRTVLITNMFVAMVASMWISNVAAPVLCFSIIQPMLRNLPSDSKFSKALILGIALASNIGGMASPIASPQNIIALQNMRPEPSWVAWFFVALPICIFSILMIWALLLVTFQPGKGTTIVPIRQMTDKFTGVQYFISFVTIGTIILWCVTHQLESTFGDMGVVAIIPLVLFFGTGILTKEDFNNFLWTIIILAAGGLSLGKAVDSSGLLHTIARSIRNNVEGMSLYGVLVVFCGLILVIATFISHTVAALIILPIVQQVGAGMDEPHPNLLVMGSALMCSAAMGLPTSGFPNMTAIMMEDTQTGQRYLRVKHFISRGIPSSALTFVVVVTIGYGLMLVVGL